MRSRVKLQDLDFANDIVLFDTGDDATETPLSMSNVRLPM